MHLYVGITFNWGALMGWTAIHGIDGWSHIIPLYGAGICWTLVYDTLYGHQDKKDDKALGLKSTSLLFGDRYTRVHWLLLSILNCVLVHAYSVYCKLATIVGVSVVCSISPINDCMCLLLHSCCAACT
jgi:4-hydroxybenzoate polyprenyltransferase